MNESFAKLIEYIPKLITVVLLVYGLSQARRTTNDVVQHVGQFGKDISGKRYIMTKLIFNFYLILAAIIIFAMRFCDYLDNQAFLVLEFGVLGGLGLKLTWETFKERSTE